MKETIGTYYCMADANDALRKELYKELHDWIEVNKALALKTHKYRIRPVTGFDDNGEIESWYYVLEKPV